MPIIGITASSIQPSIFAGDFESIATVVVGSGGAADIEFTSIPSTFQHLQIRAISKSSTTTTDAIVSVNGNAVARRHVVFGNGSSVSAGTAADGNGIPSATSATASVFAVYVMDVLDYKDTNKNKTIRVLGGVDLNGSGTVSLSSYLYSTNTNAITSIKITGNASFAQYSHFALYGCK